MATRRHRVSGSRKKRRKLPSVAGWEALEWLRSQGTAARVPRSVGRSLAELGLVEFHEPRSVARLTPAGNALLEAADSGEVTRSRRFPSGRP